MSEVKLSDQVRLLFLEALCGLRRGRRGGEDGRERKTERNSSWKVKVFSEGLAFPPPSPAAFTGPLEVAVVPRSLL